MHSGMKYGISVHRHPQLPLLTSRQQTPCQSRHTHVLAWREQRDKQDMYEHALELSRLERYDEARQAFQQLLSQNPSFCRGWVSYAQMERRAARTQDPQRLTVARAILQRGLQINPGSGCLAQAWGLMELQKGNAWAAVRLLERSVALDPVLEPVLKWKPVNAARMTVASAVKASARPGQGGRLAGSPAARVACASAGGIGGAAAAAGPRSAGASSGVFAAHEVQGTSHLGGGLGAGASSCMSSM